MARRLAPTLPLVEPIVPVLYPTPFDGPEWLFEPKYDGFRGLLYLAGRECHFRSKRGNVLRRFEQLCYWVREELVERDVILDGEVIALDQEGRQDFRLLMRGGGNLHYAVFDVLWFKGKDLRDCPLSRRKRILGRLVKKTSTVLSPIFGIRGRGRDLFRAVERLDLEGVVAKRLADPHAGHCLAEDPQQRVYANGGSVGLALC
jgi:bifunctional non-homologous end joining protein LigD